ncbi:MAG: outer membrane protein assembly factor BamD [Saprospiraceae bacterium]|nr:outer membrane protein assembly factor BamD [Saprospiraceae bacterium]MCB0542583.1 outer membrane protein assembly factor BamD [Saprospiraceae bacterium]MCB0574672.1 outer membrane protein assembly factor BamD [Saprospiraceae bacterium]MCB9308206.1 outer membrane protein assembly factor BamD [Lewinellaceae bacterium]
MRKTLSWLAFSGLFLLLGACKSNFEQVRTSGNPDLILKKAFDYYEKEEYLRAQTLFELVLTSIKGRAEAEKANFYYSYTHYHLKQYLLAAYYFKNFSNTFTNSEFREEAAFMSAYSNYQMSPSYRLDQTNTQKAIEEFQLFVNFFPKSSRVAQCNNLIDELRRKLEKKAFAEGELYYNLRQYQSAVISFDNLLRDYPESPDVERVRFLIAKGSFLLSENSILEKKQERYNETIVRCNDFLEKYSDGKYAKEIAEIRKKAEQALKDLKKRIKST